MGRTQAVAGLAAGLGLAAVVHAPQEIEVLGVGLAVVLTYASDLDHPNATAVRVLGWPGRVLCWTLRTLSEAAGMPAHRGLTHTLGFALVVTAMVGGPAAYLFGWYPGALLATYAFTGTFVGMLCDLPTNQSLRYLMWPLTDTWHVPHWLRFPVAGRRETLVCWVLVVLAVALTPFALRA